MWILSTGRAFFLIVIFLFCSGCSFLPGFGLFEQPALYFIDVNTVANQVSCELQAFVKDREATDGLYQPLNRWLLADEDAKIALTLQTDESGYVNFTGVNISQIGLQSLASFITTQSKIPSLGAKLSTKRTKSVEVDFTVSTKTSTITTMKKGLNEKGEVVPLNCAAGNLDETPLGKLYLRDWLTNYFDTINYTAGQQYPKTSYPPDELLRAARKNIVSPPQIPDQFKIQTVKLTTTIVVAVDLSAGATPNLLGNGSVFILPINGLGFDYNPDYSHKIDITLSMCDSHGNNKCTPSSSVTGYSDLLGEQCSIYAKLAPLLPSVSPPKNFDEGNHEYRCNKLGHFEETKTQAPYMPPRQPKPS